MTGLEKIIDVIQKSALAEAETIIGEANAEAAKVLGENEEKVKIKTDAMIAEANSFSAGIIESTSSNMQLQARQELLAVKQRLIRKTVSQAQDAVVNLDDKSYLDLFYKLAAKTDSSDKGELFLNQRDKERIGKELVNSFPKNIDVTLAEETADILGGFLLVSGNVTINCSIEAIFADNYNQISDTIKQVLFDD